MNSTSRLHLAPATALWLAAVASSGCGGGESWKATTHPAHGKLQINNSAPVGAVVELRTLGENKVDARNSRPWGIVGEDGSYKLGTYAKEDGAPAGEYVITVRWSPDVHKPSLEDRLKGEFSKPETSQWKVTIKEGDNELPEVAISAPQLNQAQAAEPAVEKKKPRGPAMGK